MLKTIEALTSIWNSFKALTEPYLICTYNYYNIIQVKLIISKKCKKINKLVLKTTFTSNNDVVCTLQLVSLQGLETAVKKSIVCNSTL